MGGAVTARFDPTSFFHRAEHVALHVPAGDVFGFGCRALDLPEGWGALVTRENGSDTAVASGGTVEGADARSVLFTRLLPFEVTLPDGRAFTRDGFEAQFRTRLRIMLMPERDELVAFRGAVLSGQRVANAASVVGFLAPIATRTLTAWVASRTAEQALGQDLPALGAALCGALQPLLFNAGLSLCGDPVIELDSAAFANVQRTREAASRRAQEIEAQGRVRRAQVEGQEARVAGLSTVVARLREMAKESPHASIPDLIRTFPLAERGGIFEAAFAEGSGRATQWVVVAAGDELLFLDPERTESVARRCPVEGPAGSIRSIRHVAMGPGQSYFLVGAARGVNRIPVEGATPDRVWLATHGERTRGGFNAACLTPEAVFASHSELGLWRWATNGGAGDTVEGERWAEALTRGARSVRGVRFDGGEVFCAVDQRVIALRDGVEPHPAPTFFSGSREAITSFCATPTEVFAGNAAGEVLRWSRVEPDRPQRLHQGAVRAVESLWLAEAHGIRRLVFSDTSSVVHALMLDEACSTRYEAGGQTLRRVEPSQDLMVALTEMRDRLLLWKTGQPSVAFATVNVVGLCGHTVQDFCLVPAN